jgi:putative membrane protein
LAASIELGTCLYTPPPKFIFSESMTGAPPPYQPEGYGHPRGPGPRRWIFLGLAVVLIVLAVFAVLLFLFPSSFGYSGPGPYGGGFRVFGGFLLVILVVWIVLWIVRLSMWGSRGRRYGGGGYGPRGPRSAAHIARIRYARGEITREQFEQIMQDLERRPLPPQ